MMDEYPEDQPNKLAERQPNHVSDTHRHLVNTSAGTMQMNSGIMDGQLWIWLMGWTEGGLVHLCVCKNNKLSPVLVCCVCRDSVSMYAYIRSHCASCACACRHRMCLCVISVDTHVTFIFIYVFLLHFPGVEALICVYLFCLPSCMYLFMQKHMHAYIQYTHTHTYYSCYYTVYIYLWVCIP